MPNAASPPPRTVLLKDYAPPPYLIDSVRLDVRLHARETRVVAQLKMRANPAVAKRAAKLVLDGEHIALVSVAMDGKVLTGRDYKATPNTLEFASVPEGVFTLDIVTTCNPTANAALSGLYLSRGIYTTQCEAEGFRRITYFLDRPDVLATYTVRVEADPAEAAVLLSNGNLVERGTLDGGRRHYAVWKDPHPKPSYLFALVGGNLAAFASTFKTMSGREVDLRIYVEPGKEGHCAWAMDALKRSMRWDEEAYGREYDLDVFNIVAVSDFNMGAMENKGLNIFNDRLILASPETATDDAYASIERVVAHEYFHNWTGNRITCRDWFQLCLKEGLTVYRDQEFTADMRSRAVERIDDVASLKLRQFTEDAGPLAHSVRPERYIEINNFYTATVYDKGAELVRMIATLVGAENFRKAMDLYFARHDGEAATVEQFLACFAEVSKRDLGQFMRWYAQAGTPELKCTLKHDAASAVAELIVEQVVPPTPGQPSKQPMLFPLRLGLLDAKGRDLPLEKLSNEVDADGAVEITAARQTFRFRGVIERPVPSLLRGFSAPVKLVVDYSDDDLLLLARHDSDPFNRWQAVQDIAMRHLLGAVAAHRAGKRAPKPTGLVAALGEVVAEKRLEPAFRAQLLTMPAEVDVMRTLVHDIDPDAVHKAVRDLAKSIGRSLGAALERVYAEEESKSRYAPDARQAGRRALRNRAMALLFARGSEVDIDRVRAHFESAGNATDESRAFALLVRGRSAERHAALARFYARWQNDHIVIDQWFAAQAAIPRDSTLAAVERLTQHPRFNLKTPNKVGALIGTFAMANHVQFHRADGAGYHFVGAKVREIDAFNPQLAARLLNAFRSWQSIEAGRQRHARKALLALSRTKGLSNDVFEIIAKMLG